ncbi:nitrate reductase cytochrome c-type subunit; periplasmic nitrate reductase electron transfer subunit [Phaeobacter gallaeciensis]|uniref:Periplasmic nitrate reductase, electron transfer subunit n=1 Tax=Phaeobacter gallaeciensis TaxID=60890 RepID=A0A366X1Z1_9RHOB|nr:nitrate reductase cytochrome c-type subunit [Phaeobacter gallaeciensis]RBW58463.1 nitrate reductase cytochrome c-type subunit; periplasmic nitrate reductase electron transfer subunit [Phaeobacter gallaeciensis]
MKGYLFLSLPALIVVTGVVAQEQMATFRQGTPLHENATPPAIAKVNNSDLRQTRNYPEQPPLIPHKIDGYQIDVHVNQCLQCHSRAATEVSQAPMVSITHFMNRENQFLTSITPRRYFCNQCHVTQGQVRELVGNQFIDVDTVLDIARQPQDGGD